MSQERYAIIKRFDWYQYDRGNVQMKPRYGRLRRKPVNGGSVNIERWIQKARRIIQPGYPKVIVRVR